MQQSLTGIIALFVLSGALGCAKVDPHGRQSLTGTITFKGQPLDVGTIEFVPSQAGKGYGTIGMIKDGKYQVPSEQGVPPGTYRVLICSPEANKSEGPVGPPGMKMPPLGKDRISPQYNRDSRITVEVKPSGDNRFDFSVN